VSALDAHSGEHGPGWPALARLLEETRG
jgi:hypothetical protein